MNNIVIVGAGGFGRDTKTVIDAINSIENKYNLLGYYDDGKLPNTPINNLKVLGSIKDLAQTNDKLQVAIAIANPYIREKIANELVKNTNLTFPNIIHPNNLPLADFTTLGIGNIVCGFVGISCNVNFSNFCIVNTLCSIGHDTKLNDFVSIMPGVNVSGEVVLHKNVYLGVGATVINQVTIHKNVTVGAGAVVVNNITQPITVVGVPAKELKKCND